jgi:hypothetical protein
LVKRTRATFRKAELGFFGVVVYTRTQTPRTWGQRFMAGALVLVVNLRLLLRTNWLIVGIRNSLSTSLFHVSFS